MQPETKYYKTVPVSERLPEKPGVYFCKVKDDAEEIFNGMAQYSFGSWWDMSGRSEDSCTVIEWLEPIPLPDAERLRDKMQEIEYELRGEPSEENASRAYNIAREALSQTGDGWVEIKEGCEMPDWGDSVTVILPKIEGEYFNPFTAKYKGDGFYVKDKRVEKDNFHGEPSHWRPLPSPPQNK